MIDAIYKLNPTVVTIRGDEAFDAAGNPVAYNEAAVQAYITANAYKGQRAAADVATLKTIMEQLA